MDTQKGRKRTGYLIKRGAVYHAVWTVNGKKMMRSTKQRNRRAAEAELAKIMAPLVFGDETEILENLAAKIGGRKAEVERLEVDKSPPLSMENAWAAYLAATNRPDSSDRTLQGYNAIWRRFAGWLADAHPGITDLREVDNGVAAAYASRLTADGVTASTYNQHVGFLRLLWRVLADLIRGDGNPWDRIQKKRLQKLEHRHKAVTPEQLNALLEGADDPELHDLLFTLAWIGQRLVDGVMLRWDSIDFNRRVITIYPRKTARTGKPVHIPLLPQLAELLEKRRLLIEGDLLFPNLAQTYERDNSAIVKRIQGTFERAGLEPRQNRPGVKRAVACYGAHSLRHFYATQALAAGIPAEIVKRITGHSSDAMLEGYEHLDAAMIGKLADRLSHSDSPALPAGGKRALQAPGNGEPGRLAGLFEAVLAGLEGMTPDSLDLDRAKVSELVRQAQALAGAA